MIHTLRKFLPAVILASVGCFFAVSLVVMLPLQVEAQDVNFQAADCETSNGESLTKENCAIIGHLITGINVLSALAGMAIVASLMIAGYQYMTARDNAGQIQQAKTRIIWAITALLLFIFMYALLNFLIPGGVL